MWDVAFLPNGDFITGCSDSVARVFTSDEVRTASNEVIAEYEKSIAEQQVGVKGKMPQVILETWIRHTAHFVSLFVPTSLSSTIDRYISLLCFWPTNKKIRMHNHEKVSTKLIGGVDLAKLSDADEALNVPGTKDGENKIVRRGKNAEGTTQRRHHVDRTKMLKSDKTKLKCLHLFLSDTNSVYVEWSRESLG